MIRVLSIVSLLCAGAASAEVVREEIRRVPVPGSETMEVVVMRLTIPLGATMPMHSHHGDEHAVVIQGGMAELPNGNVVPFEVGQTLYFPQGAVHGGLKAVGDTALIAITTSVVVAGKDLIIPAGN